jgi:pimeloyl-ACP methyl ester carboxylesterase
VDPLARLVTVDPYCEDAHVLLIQAYDALGDGTRAAGAYDRYQGIVRRELSAEPRPALASRFEGRACHGRSLPREDFVPLKEVTLHIVDWRGGGPAVLAVHGSAGIGHNFAALADRLAPRHRMIGADLRGHGFSDKPPTGYDLERHVEDVVQLIQTLRLRRPVLLGHSAGGAVAAVVAASTDVGGLIILEGMIGDRAFAENARPSRLRSPRGSAAPRPASTRTSRAGAPLVRRTATTPSDPSIDGRDSPWPRGPVADIASERSGRRWRPNGRPSSPPTPSEPWPASAVRC